MEPEMARELENCGVEKIRYCKTSSSTSGKQFIDCFQQQGWPVSEAVDGKETGNMGCVTKKMEDLRSNVGGCPKRSKARL
jgi:hypothetical protein